MRLLLLLFLQGAAAINGRGQACSEREQGSRDAYCFADYPAYSYDAFLALYLTWFAVVGLLAAVRWREAHRLRGGGPVKRASAGRTGGVATCWGRASPRELILAEDAVACLLRVAWLVDVWNGRDASVLLLGERASEVLLRTPQLVLVAAMTRLLLTWDGAARRLAAFRAIQLDRAASSPGGTELSGPPPESWSQRLLRYVLLALTCLIIPIDAVLTIYVGSGTSAPVVVIQCVITAWLTVVGAGYVARLSRLLKDSESERLQRMGRVALRVVAALVVNGAVTLLLLLTLLAPYSAGMEIAWFYAVHGVEAVSATALLYGMWSSPAAAPAADRPSEPALGGGPVAVAASRPQAPRRHLDRLSLNMYADSEASDSPRVSLLHAVHGPVSVAEDEGAQWERIQSASIA